MQANIRVGRRRALQILAGEVESRRSKPQSYPTHFKCVGPMPSLQVITKEPPLQIRRYKLSLKYYYKMKSLPQNSAFKFITPEQETLYANKNSPPPFAIRIKEMHTKFNLENKGVLPDFSYYRLDIKEPTWGLPCTRIN